MKLGDISTLLLGERATLPVGGLGALGPGNSLAFLLLDSLALPLLNLGAFFLGNVLAFLGSDVTAHLLVVNFLADLLGHRVAFLTINSLALATRNILQNIEKNKKNCSEKTKGDKFVLT